MGKRLNAVGSAIAKPFKTLFHWLGTWQINWGFLREDSPYSLLRLGVMFILFTFWPPFLILWIWFSISSMTLVAIPPSIQWLLGIAFGAKAGQKAMEVLPDIVGRYRERKKHERIEAAQTVPPPQQDETQSTDDWDPSQSQGESTDNKDESTKDK